MSKEAIDKFREAINQNTTWQEEYGSAGSAMVRRCVTTMWTQRRFVGASVRTGRDPHFPRGTSSPPRPSGETSRRPPTPTPHTNPRHPMPPPRNLYIVVKLWEIKAGPLGGGDVGLSRGSTGDREHHVETFIYR